MSVSVRFQVTVVVDAAIPDQMDGESYHVFVARAREYAQRELRHTIAENNRLRLVTASRPRKVD